MVYGRRVTRSKMTRPGIRAPRFKRRSKVRKAVKKYVRRMLDRNVEDKGIYVGSTYFNTVSTTWSELMLSMPSIGTGNDQRIGRAIKIKSITMYGTLKPCDINTLSDDNNRMRIVVAGWRGSSSALPLTNDGVLMDQPIIKKPLMFNHRNVQSDLLKKYKERYINWDPIASAPTVIGDAYIYKPRKKFYCRVYFPKGKIVRFDDLGTATWKLGVHMLSDSSVVPHPGMIDFKYWMIYEDA